VSGEPAYGMLQSYTSVS